MLTQIDNENKDGNNDSYRYEYNGLKQLVQTTETNPQAVFTKNYTYDNFGRVQKETTTAEAAGKRASAVVQYRYQNGELVEMKDDKGITLWKLTASNEYGQPLSLHKGKTKELLDYNSHFPKTQTVQREDTPLNVLQYDFNPQRGLLNHRTYSFYNQKEEFAYDPTDRLTRWGNATHQYDERGRITENSAIGTYEYTRNGYQQQKLTTNEAGETHLEKYPLPVIRYNAFKAPEQIYVKDKERISYEYNAFCERSHCYYGNAEVEKAKRPMLKHYSHDGSVEIVCNKTDNSTKFILYLGGDAYSAPAILISNGEAQKLYYLHRDYLGSIVMLTDENGNIAERRHFDPWGQPIKVEDAAGNTLDKLTLLDRGFTGHEHLQTVGLINMNARLYDPALHRFLQPDNFVQDPFNTQNFNRYGYCLNNPLVYVDENGEFLWWVVGAAALIGAYTGGTIANNGEANPIKWNYSDNWGYILGGAAIGALSAYVGGSVASAIGLGSLSSNGALLGASIGGAVGGGISGAGFSAMGGNNVFKGFLNGMISGFVGGAIGSYIGGFGGAFAGGMSGSFTNSILYGESFENAFYSGIIGGVISYGLYNLQMKNSYNQYKKEGGEWSYKQYRKISTASQRSFAREKEFGGWITNDDVLIDPSSGRGKDFHTPSTKPNTAIGRFHTHPNSVKAGYLESHSSSDIVTAGFVQKVDSYVIGRENIFRYDVWKYRIGAYDSTNMRLPMFRYPFYNPFWLSSSK